MVITLWKLRAKKFAKSLLQQRVIAEMLTQLVVHDVISPDHHKKTRITLQVYESSDVIFARWIIARYFLNEKGIIIFDKRCH
jgi:hypothetical protein